MATSPVTPVEDHGEVELYTPSNISFSKDYCQEITPDDDLKTHQTTPLPKPNKVLAADKNKSLKEKGHKLSKRKLFPGQSINTISGNESACGIVEKKKKSETESCASDPKHSPACCPVKLPLSALTERQQLAFLLEVTSTHSSSQDCFDNENVKEGFTKVKPRGKGKKNKMVAVNPRVYRRNERGETPLHTATIKGDVDGMKKLINDGADVGAKDYAGWTALHEACNYGNLAAAQILLDHGAPVNTPGFEGDTPLHDAVINNHVEVADMLLSSGADFRQENTKGKSPIYFIATKEMREVFASHGVQLATTPPLPVTNTSSRPALDCNEILESSKGKTTHNYKGPLRGNDIQRKQTQGESKMEKPVMYMCTLTAVGWEKEIKVTTTQAFCGQESEKVETSEKPGVKLHAESETGNSLLPKDEGIASKNEENPFVLQKEKPKAVSHRECSAAEVTGDIFEEVLEGPKDEEFSVNALPKIKESSLDHLQVSPLQEIILSTVAEEVVRAEKRSDAIGQGETELTFQGRYPHSQEEPTPGTSKGMHGEGGEVDTGGVLMDESEIVVRNLGPSDGDSNESGNSEAESLIRSGSAAASLEPASLRQNTSTRVEVQGITSRKEYRFSGGEIEASRNPESSIVLGLHRNDLITLELADPESNETNSKESDVKCGTKSQEARSRLDKLVPCSTGSPNPNAFPRVNKAQGPRALSEQSHVVPRRSLNNCKVNERRFSCRNVAALKPKWPTVTWRSLLAENKCGLKELKVPYYEQFLINTKDYELANGATTTSLQQVTTGLASEKEKLLLKQEREKGELTRKQKSEEDKLQICMEQEIVRFYAKNAYSSLKRSPPPGVCTTLFWQNMTQQRLKIEKRKIAQKRVLESSSSVSENTFQEIIGKYDKLKEVMALRHRHEQQALDAVNKREIENV